MIVDFWNKAKKTVTAVIVAVIGWTTLVVQSGSGAITATEWIAGATMLAMALGVYTVTNQPAVPVADPGPEV